MQSDDTDTDSYSENMTDTEEGFESSSAGAAMVIRALLETFKGDDAHDSINPEVLGLLLNSYQQLNRIEDKESVDNVAKICYSICRIASKHRVNPEAIDQVVTLIDWMLDKALATDGDKPRVLIKASFADSASSTLTRFKQTNKKNLKDKALNSKIEATQEKLDRLQYMMLNTYHTSSDRARMFSSMKAIDFITKSDKLAQADHYFVDWDETLYDNGASGLYAGLKGLIEMAAFMGVTQHIITARHVLLDNAKNHLLCDEERNVGRVVSRALGSGIGEQLDNAKINHIIQRHHIIYCNFHNARQDDEVVKRIKGPAIKSKKIEDYQQYCEKNTINPKATLIFDDKRDVWTKADGKRVSRLRVVDNRDPRKSTFAKMVHAISQRILYNEKIDLDTRISAANQLHALLETQGWLYEKLADALKTFAAQELVKVQTLHS